jgi:hypothetical protein
VQDAAVVTAGEVLSLRLRARCGHTGYESATDAPRARAAAFLHRSDEGLASVGPASATRVPASRGPAAKAAR